MSLCLRDKESTEIVLSLLEESGSSLSKSSQLVTKVEEKGLLLFSPSKKARDHFW
jgi:hypothetical protein